ncbi:MAG TPA: dihydrofolate reductase family protein [Ktedonobacteraceae bacterium]|nr:dihydrofolate reductase family protein [Ktedonobacteraceae bacterium]
MGKVIVDLSISLDGFITGPNPRPGLGLGEGGQRLHDWMFPPKGDFSEIVEEMFKHVGAVLMGRRSFAVGEEPWGENPPFHMPVFVLTHDAKETITKEGGTTYTFVTDGIESLLAQAKAAAGDKDVCLHGASIAQQCLQAGLLDEIGLHLVPILLGQGTRLFEQLGTKPIELERMEVIASQGVTHLRFRVVK